MQWLESNGSDLNKLLLLRLLWCLTRRSPERRQKWSNRLEPDSVYATSSHFCWGTIRFQTGPNRTGVFLHVNSNQSSVVQWTIRGGERGRPNVSERMSRREWTSSSLQTTSAKRQSLFRHRCMQNERSNTPMSRQWRMWSFLLRHMAIKPSTSQLDHLDLLEPRILLETGPNVSHSWREDPFSWEIKAKEHFSKTPLVLSYPRLTLCTWCEFNSLTHLIHSQSSPPLLGGKDFGNGSIHGGRKCICAVDGKALRGAN